MCTKVLSSIVSAWPVRQGRGSRRGNTRLLFFLSLSATLMFVIATGAARAEDDLPNIETVTYDSGGASLRALVARPQGAEKHAGVLVIHDDSGVTDGLKDTVRKLAGAGFLAMAPDLSSRSGGASNAGDVQSRISALRPRTTVEDVQAALSWLKAEPAVDAREISCIGFGWGGWRTFELAEADPDLRHAVIFYGATPVSGLEKVHASVLANYAQYDFFDTGNSLWTEDTLTRSGAKFTSYIYAKAFRGFFDSGNPHYDPEAAKIAWSRTLEFLKK